MLNLILFLPFIGAIIVKSISEKISIFTGIFITLLDFIFLTTLYFGGNFKIFSNLYGISFLCDSLSFLFALTSLFVGLFIFIYSLNYFHQDKERKEFSFWALIFLGSMLGVVFSDNLISLYLFWEIAGICSWRLIGFYRESEHLLKADKAFMLTTAGSGIMFLSFAYIYSKTGTFSLSQMNEFPVSSFVFLIFFIGVITKSATFPLHAWLPDASVAPTPVTAFLHAAVLVKIGIYALIRIFVKTFVIEGNVIWFGYLGLISSLIAGTVALIEKDIKKILAYSTVSQLGFMIAGILSGSKIAFIGVCIFYFSHALGKGSLFLNAGIIEKLFKTKDITKMGNLFKEKPYISLSFLISMLCVAGIPPIIGFYGKLKVIMGILNERLFLYSFLAILSSFLTFLYLLRLFLYVFLREKEDIQIETTETKIMEIATVSLSIVLVFSGIVFPFLIGGLIGL